jgi:hypothetical protein
MWGHSRSKTRISRRDVLSSTLSVSAGIEDATSRDDPAGARYTKGMAEILVECYAGFRADERPLRFTLRGRVFEVAEVEDRWYSPGAIYFRIRADDGNFYIVRHDEGRDAWTLEGFRASGSSGTPPDPAERGAPNGPHGAS